MLKTLEKRQYVYFQHVFVYWDYTLKDPANKLRNNYVFFGHFLVTNKSN